MKESLRGSSIITAVPHTHHAVHLESLNLGPSVVELLTAIEKTGQLRERLQRTLTRVGRQRLDNLLVRHPDHVNVLNVGSVVGDVDDGRLHAVVLHRAVPHHARLESEGESVGEGQCGLVQWQPVTDSGDALDFEGVCLLGCQRETGAREF